MIRILFPFIMLFAASANAYAEIDSSSCEKSLSNIREPNIACSVYLKLNEKEKTELKAATSEAIHDLSCEAVINANKADVVRTLSEPNVKLPLMMFKCSILFNDGVSKIAAFDISPEFSFGKDRVIKASLNIGEVSGIGFLGRIVKNQLSSESTNMQLVDAANTAIEKLTQ